MDRRTFIGGVAIGLVAAPHSAGAQSTGRKARIGILAGGSSDANAMRSITEPLQQGLRDLGYVEAQNIAFEYRWADGKTERLPALAAELVRLDVDVIFAANPQAARAAKNATSTIPIVFTAVGDPVAEGLVASLSRPGGNATGMSVSGGVDIAGKRLQLLKELVPSVDQFAMLTNPDNPSHAPALKGVPAFARALAINLRFVEARRREDLDGVFVALAKDHVGGLVVLADTFFTLQAARLVELSARYRLPTVYGNRVLVDAGGLMSLQGDFAAMNRRAASFVGRILKGARPADLPVENPTKFDLVINLKTAKAFGLTIPQSLLLRVDEVIQ
jgi:putative tryptophan/tyrosine transport system substrate-binding protein